MEVVLVFRRMWRQRCHWEDVPRHLLEQIALEGYLERWLAGQIAGCLVGTRMQVHGFLKAHGGNWIIRWKTWSRIAKPIGT